MRMMGRLVWRGQRWEDTSRTHGQVRAAEKRQWRQVHDHFTGARKVIKIGGGSL